MEYVTLNDGNRIPSLGYGVFEIPDGECAECVSRAIACGYTHIDTAQIYGNEAGVGDAVASCGVPRGGLYLTSKVWVKQFGYEKTLKSIEQSLKKLKTPYLDLMLLHRPYFDYLGAWKALEKAREEGLVKSIGLSNFTQKQTEEILGIAHTVPAVNQIELHPYYSRRRLKEYLAEKGVATEAWYPLGHGNKGLVNNPLFGKLAEKYGKTPSQIILRWHIQSGNIIFPKTRSEAHMRENMGIFSFALEDEDMRAIDLLDRNKPLFRIPDWWQKLTIRLSL